MLVCDQLTIAAGSFRLGSITFTVPRGAYAVMMGQTGSGKTSLLEAICGLRAVESGSVQLGGDDVTRLRPSERGIGYVPQDAAVFPRMTVRQNLAFGLVARRWSPTDIEARVHSLAEQLQIGHLLDRGGKGLSGGESQRVALGRALAPRPAVLLLDEPLSALDEPTREQMIALLRQVQRESGCTALHVTHSRSEAEALADLQLEIVGGRVAVREPVAAG